MTAIKQHAHNNQLFTKCANNILMGGNYDDSSFNHSFGPFIHRDFKLFDPKKELNDFPIDMKYEFALKDFQEKLPHQRMVFDDKQAKDITIKILMLQIMYSTNHHNSDSR